MEGFNMLRLVLSIALLGVVSFVAVKHFRHGDHHWHHHGEHHHELRKKMYEAHECHQKCGEDVSCHSKCPKPLAALAKACDHFPVVQKCMDSCKGTDCDKCATFEEDWINRKFLKHPEKAMRKAERKCPSVVSAHSCHIGCKRGDFKCHSQCPSIFHHHWHHREGHRGNHDDDEHHHHCEFREKMFEAHACHEKCGEDVSCHSKCPKPLAALAKACDHFPVVQKCMDSCKGTDCDKCATFEEDWINKKFLKHPEKAMRKAERKCPSVVSAHSCHIGCKRGDFKCHSQCPSIFHHHWHHREGHRGNHDDDDEHHHREFREKMFEADACHEKCGEDVSCHSKCPKPLASLAKACEHLPAVKECMVIVSTRSCHIGCKRGDFKCHSQCQSKFFDHDGLDRRPPQMQYQRYRPRFMEKDLEKPGIIV